MPGLMLLEKTHALRDCTFLSSGVGRVRAGAFVVPVGSLVSLGSACQVSAFKTVRFSRWEALGNGF